MVRGAFDLCKAVREAFPALSLMVESSCKILASWVSSSEHRAWLGLGSVPSSSCLIN